jgi:hypothetical protein
MAGLSERRERRAPHQQTAAARSSRPPQTTDSQTPLQHPPTPRPPRTETPRDVEVVLTTHAIKGLSMSDFVMAAKLDTLPVDYSPKFVKDQTAAGLELPGQQR